MKDFLDPSIRKKERGLLCIESIEGDVSCVYIHALGTALLQNGGMPIVVGVVLGWAAVFMFASDQSFIWPQYNMKVKDFSIEFLYLE